MTSTTVAKVVYERLEQELQKERSEHGLELAKLENQYQERIAKMQHDIDTYKDVGKHYEVEIARLDALLSQSTEKQQKALDKLVEVTRELEAAKGDMKVAAQSCDDVCSICKHYNPDLDCDIECEMCNEQCACYQCDKNSKFVWRGLCEANGGAPNDP